MTNTTVHPNWDISDPSTWSLSVTVDAHMGYHRTGVIVREYRTFSASASDIEQSAQWWSDVITALIDANCSIAEASPEELETIRELIDIRDESDDLEDEANACRRIVAALDEAT